MLAQHGQQLFEPVDVFLRQELCSLDASPKTALLLDASPQTTGTCCLAAVLKTSFFLLFDTGPQTTVICTS